VVSYDTKTALPPPPPEGGEEDESDDEKAGFELKIRSSDEDILFTTGPKTAAKGESTAAVSKAQIESLQTIGTQEEEMQFSTDQNQEVGGISGVLLPPTLEELEAGKIPETPVPGTSKKTKKPTPLDEAMKRTKEAESIVTELSALLEWAKAD